MQSPRSLRSFVVICVLPPGNCDCYAHHTHFPPTTRSREQTRRLRDAQTHIAGADGGSSTRLPSVARRCQPAGGGAGPAARPLTRHLARIGRHVDISTAALAGFVRFCPTSTPALPDNTRAASHLKGRERYEGFLQALGRRLARGQRLENVVIREVDADATASPRKPRSVAIRISLIVISYRQHASN